MKLINLLIVMVVFSSISLADQLYSTELSERSLDAELNSVSGKQEDMKCYPISTVKKWAAKKKKPPVVVERIVEKEVIKEAPKNNLSLLGGRTETGLKASSSYPTMEAHTTGEFDLGLMYQRRLSDHIRASVIGTMNGSFYGGLGYDF